MKKLSRKNTIILSLLSIMLTVLMIISFTYLDYQIQYKSTLSNNGLELLNEYEFPWYLTEVAEDGSYCLRPYDVGDGVITFGPGITYSDEQSGLNEVNQMFDVNYTLENNCIDVDYLFALQTQVLEKYEKDVSKFAFKHHLKLSKNEFDALVILDYNSPNFLKDENVIEMLCSDPSKEEYINDINHYYQELDSYYDNIYTDEKNDGYGVGWYNRIIDSAEVYFEGDYDFQNNRINSFNEIE